MRCINRRFTAFALALLLLCSLTGCGQTAYSMAFDLDDAMASYSLSTNSINVQKATPFAIDLCVTSSDVTVASLDMTGCEAVFFCCLDDGTTLYAQNANKQLNPASLTKVMTAYLALKYGNLDDTLTASANVEITESGASLIGLKTGDTMTLEQALYGLMLPSGNDAAVLIAEYIAGSVEAFADLMNEEANALGATNSHFVNPHGLTEEDHYVTAYDMYLIFNAAMGYEQFVTVISTTEYSTIYHDANGEPKELSCTNTNQFVNGNRETPSGVTVIGGKTGTTNAAGSCLILLAESSSGKQYISVVLKSTERDVLYTEMYDLMNYGAK